MTKTDKKRLELITAELFGYTTTTRNSSPFNRRLLDSPAWRVLVFWREALGRYGLSIVALVGICNRLEDPIKFSKELFADRTLHSFWCHETRLGLFRPNDTFRFKLGKGTYIRGIQSKTQRPSRLTLISEKQMLDRLQKGISEEGARNWGNRGIDRDTWETLKKMARM